MTRSLTLSYPVLRMLPKLSKHASTVSHSRFSRVTVAPLLVAFLLRSVSSFAPYSIPLPAARTRRHQRQRLAVSTPFGRLPAKKYKDDDDQLNDGKNEDWRAFRAMLVQTGVTTVEEGVIDLSDANSPNSMSSDTRTDDNRPPAKDPSSLRYAFESTPLVEVGTILLSVPTTDLSQALERQYRHRSAILITSVHDNDRSDQAAAKPPPHFQASTQNDYGSVRWSYRGLLLNRPIGLGLEGNCLYGGDCDGPSHDDMCTEYTCLHSLERSDHLTASSTRILGDLSITTLEEAQRIYQDCSDGRIQLSDFAPFTGFCGWGPGELEREMGEGEWLALSIDSRTIMDEMTRLMEGVRGEGGSGGDQRPAVPVPTHRLIEAGTAMWRNFLDMVGRSEDTATGRIPAGQLEFYDRMLEVWAEENLSADGGCGCRVSTDGVGEEGRGENNECIDSGSLIGPGTLVRATGDVSNEVLLRDPELVRSLILVLQETPYATVGIILNHPLAAALECYEGGPSLPLRYGGPFVAVDFLNYVKEGLDITDDIEGYTYYDDDDPPFLWLHRDADLGSCGPEHGGGSPLGTSGVWFIHEDEAIDALQAGTLKQEDTMVFSGVCVWGKDPDCHGCGGMTEQIDFIRSMEVVRSCDQDDGEDHVIDKVWDILDQGQDVLLKETLETNVDAAGDAWVACTGLMGKSVADQSTAKSSGRENLSDATLRAWLGVNLLRDPCGTLVEVKSKAQ